MVNLHFAPPRMIRFTFHSSEEDVRVGELQSDDPSAVIFSCGDDRVSHQDGEDTVSLNRIVNLHLQQSSLRDSWSRLPKLLDSFHRGPCSAES